METGLTSRESFEKIKHQTDQGKEYWLARELMPLLGYDQWKNFHKVVLKAQKSIASTYPQINHHFAEISKKIKVGSGTNKEAIREILDFKLSRHACYVIAQNGDSTKHEIALAQGYFAQQTQKQEMLDDKRKLQERFRAREKLKETEKKMSGILADHDVDNRGIGAIRSAGDEALFNQSTQEMKAILNVASNKPLADHLPTITLKAKDLAAEMTSYKTLNQNLRGTEKIKREHVHNNSQVRKLLTENGIFPETLPAEEDINRIKQRLSSSEPINSQTTALSEVDFITISLVGEFDLEDLERVKELIVKNPGDVDLKIIYGHIHKPNQIIRKINPTAEVLSELEDYLI